MTLTIRIGDDLTVEHEDSGSICINGCPAIMSKAHVEDLIRALVNPQGVRYGICHPSGRVLCLNYLEQEIWAYHDTPPLLFDSVELAKANLALRVAQFPMNSDWRHCRVEEYVPGILIPPLWKPVDP